VAKPAALIMFRAKIAALILLNKMIPLFVEKPALFRLGVAVQVDSIKPRVAT
jgi:hypothetical protein